MNGITRFLASLAVIAALAGAAPAVVPDDAGKATPEEKTGGPDVDNPIRKISEMMKKAGDLLAKLETGDPTQDEQKKILKELDRLIELAQKSSSSSKNQQQREQQNEDERTQPQPKNSGASTGTSPMQNERNVPRSVKPGVGTDPPDLREIWGKLPDVRRDEILQLLNEDLPQQYKELVKLYLKALSERK